MGLFAAMEATLSIMAMRWSWNEEYSPPSGSLDDSILEARDSPQTYMVSPSIPASIPILPRVSIMAAALSDSLDLSLPAPEILDSPAQNAASSAVMGKRSGALLSMDRKKFYLLL